MPRDVHAGYGVDLRDFKLLAKALRTAQAELAAEIHAELREVGKLVADEAQRIIEPFSSTIPGTIKVRVSGARVSVLAGGGRGGQRLAQVIFGAGYGGVSRGGSGLRSLEREAEGSPLAGLFELGNKGGSKSQASTSRKEFRHPVFGNKDVWVNQEMHPFLEPALKKQMPIIEERVTATANRAARTIAYDYLAGE